MRIEEVLLEDGTPSKTQEDIVATHLAFQSNLYSQKPIQESAKKTLLDTITTRVTDADTRALNQPINKEEILMAIKSLGKNKATGTDGLSAEFYQFFGFFNSRRALIFAQSRPFRTKEYPPSADGSLG